MQPGNSTVTRWLEARPKALLTFYAALAAFTTYFCMYAFRKPFSVATFDGLDFFGLAINGNALTLKGAIVISQLLGYMISKYLGIKFCSEITWQQRSRVLFALVGVAWLSLLVYGLLPGPYKVFAIFFNGLPLGMVWGLVTGYLEGRTTSEILLAALSCSFIIGSSMTKDVGKWLMSETGLGVAEGWVGFVTGAVFIVPFAIAVWMLSQLPQPDTHDIKERIQRKPMDRRERWAFVRQFLPGLIMLIAIYFLLTAYRDYWDNFGAELFKELGYGETPGIFTATSLPIAFGVMAALALLALIRNNRLGLLAVYLLMLGGILLTAGATLAYQADLVSGAAWMTLIGLGTYLTYVPFGSVLFDRIIAETGTIATAVFAIYLADAIGYTGAVGIVFYKDFFASNAGSVAFFANYTYLMAGVGVACLTGSCVYFLGRSSDEPHTASQAQAAEDAALQDADTPPTVNTNPATA
ncbi:MAG: DUF5690 family protein [Phycisphaerales bacterium JB063]